MTAITNSENLREYKSRFYLVVEQILVLASRSILAREFKNYSTFRQGCLRWYFEILWKTAFCRLYILKCVKSFESWAYVFVALD